METKYTTEEKLDILAKRLFEKLAKDVVSLEVSKLFYLTDYFLIGTVESSTQMKAIIDYLRMDGKETGIQYKHVEGLESLKWALVDFGDIVVHLFLSAERELYDLEGLWFQADKKEFKDEN